MVFKNNFKKIDESLEKFGIISLLYFYFIVYY